MKELKRKGYLEILGEERIKEPLSFNAFFGNSHHHAWLLGDLMLDTGFLLNVSKLRFSRLIWSG